jgi:hypothetical protein
MKIGDLVRCNDMPNVLDYGTLGVVESINNRVFEVTVRWPNGEVTVHKKYLVILVG